MERARLLDLEGVGIGIFLTTQLGEKEIVSWPGAAQVKGYVETGLIAAFVGDARRTRPSAFAIPVIGNADHVSAGIAEPRQDDVHF